MAIALVVNTNTFISLADAGTYFTNRIYSTLWTGTDDLKSQALIEATKRINRQIWKGRKAVYNQTLEFPRAIYSPDGYNLLFPNTVYYLHDWYAETAISQEVKDATCEEALSILTAGTVGNKRAEFQAQGVKSFTLGNMTETYETGNKKGKMSSMDAIEIMRKYVGGVQIC